ncbi:RDD family protein [Ktedonobacter racemifer]|uniref:RDD domain containing protein n=1 Tax=Ktedonobacter racemifer DSM 44963 TaxID=485913 RepID=D6TV30_KTERA|nr:RDD family protein [Ktedonobacter racemifer]EFH84130.1 RDD domain containing protein [Ktedonobacter racemifer DSM 44963]
MDYQAQESAQAAPAQQYAGVGSRFLAILIDSIILGIVFGIINAILGTALKGSFAISGIEGLLLLIYYSCMEATMGATLGKKILGLRVVKEDGSSIGWGDSIIRNLLRIIDIIPGFYLVAAILVWTSSSKQRLGDKVAHTVVVKTR